MNKPRRRALEVALAMGTTAVLAQVMKAPALDPTAEPEALLSALIPSAFSDWHVDRNSHAFVRASSGPEKVYDFYDQVLERTFMNSAGYRVMLSMASNHGAAASLRLHSPEVCYPASGYRVDGVESGMLNLAGRQIVVKHLRAELPGRKEPVTYWTVVAGRIGTERGVDGFGTWDFRWHRISLALRREVATGTLVRLSSIDPDPRRAFDVHARFAAALLGQMPPEHRRRLVGAAYEP